MGWYGDDKPYVPVAQRRAQASREVAKRLKKGEVIAPVRIEGRKIASTFWGEAWCKHLESYSDFANRLPRGRTYVRNGSVIHLAIEPGRINALVSGSSLYQIQIDIDPLSQSAWQTLKNQCAGQLGTVVELLQGKLSQGVMTLVTDRDRGLFPKPKEMRLRCNCPDSAGLCKHLAAVLYGLGNRLDTRPELLFQLRGVDHTELIEQAIPVVPTNRPGQRRKIAPADFGAVFDIELSEALDPVSTTTTKIKPVVSPKKILAPKQQVVPPTKLVLPQSKASKAAAAKTKATTPPEKLRSTAKRKDERAAKQVTAPKNLASSSSSGQKQKTKAKPSKSQPS